MFGLRLFILEMEIVILVVKANLFDNNGSELRDFDTYFDCDSCYFCCTFIFASNY
jgi:hypothetical protein